MNIPLFSTPAPTTPPTLQFFSSHSIFAPCELLVELNQEQDTAAQLLTVEANCRLQLVVLGGRGLARLKQLTPFPIAATPFKRRLRTTFLNHVWDMLQICW